jgi:class 3 adenylate cyclase/tetratricopeptide (TPR) repeat protein
MLAGWISTFLPLGVEGQGSTLAQFDRDTAQVVELLAQSEQFYGSNPDSAIILAEKALDLSREAGYPVGRAYALKNIGIAHYLKSDYPNTLDSWNQSLAIFQSISDKKGEANILGNIGGVYAEIGDFPKSLDYHLRSLKIAEEIENDEARLFRKASAYINIGVVYSNKPDTYREALDNYQKALPIGEELNDKSVIGFSTMNLGDIYLRLYKEVDSLEAYIDSSLLYFNLALESESANVPYILNNEGKANAAIGNYEEAIRLQKSAYQEARKIDRKSEMASARTGLGQTYLQMGNLNEARGSFIEGEALASEVNSRPVLLEVYSGLAETYSRLLDYRNAYEYQVLAGETEKAINNNENDEKMNQLRFQFDLEKKEAENQVLQAQIQQASILRNFLFATAIFLIITVAGISYSYWFARRSNRIITDERNRSESILLNILPEETAEELKHNGKVKAKRFEQVSVLFTDFKQFTEVSKGVPPEEIVKSVDYYFRNFDEIVSRHHLEKIKTIGDAYMCAGGLPVTNATHPQDAVSAGLELVEFVKNTRAYPPEGIVTFDIRIGIHTGPVVAGVVGTKKFQYDIWGSTVNLASMMETNSEANRVNISNGTYELIKDRFSFEYRGEITGKHGGKYKMYFVGEPVPEPESVA